jgi:sugar phosphate permease
MRSRLTRLRRLEFDGAQAIVGAVAGFINTIGILGGIVSTSIVPPLVKHYGYGGWIAAFSSGTAMGLFSAVLWWVLGKRLAKP